MEDARRRHVEEKPIAAPAGPIARLAPWLPTKCPAACQQHTLFFERSAMSLRTRKLGPTQRPSRGSLEMGLSTTSMVELAEIPTFQELRGQLPVSRLYTPVSLAKDGC